MGDRRVVAFDANFLLLCCLNRCVEIKYCNSHKFGISAMSTDVLQKAFERERELKAELEEIQAFIKVYKKLSCDVPAEETTARFKRADADEEKASDRSESATVSATTPKPARRARGRSKFKKNEVIEAAKRILEGRTEPLKNAALTDLIIESGVDIPSDNKPRYISTTLSHSDEFVAAKKRAGWMLVEQVGDNLRHQYDASYNNAPDTSASGALFEKDFE